MNALVSELSIPLEKREGSNGDHFRRAATSEMENNAPIQCPIDEQTKKTIGVVLRSITFTNLEVSLKDGESCKYV